MPNLRRKKQLLVLAAAILLVLCLTPLVSNAKRIKRNKQVEATQQALHDKGYDPGPIDGVMGPKTREALGSYQKAQDLPVTQRADAKTAASLGVSASASRESSRAGSKESAGATFKTAGHDFGKGGAQFGKELAKGKPIEAGKDLGKGFGDGGENTGEGVAKAVTH